MRKTFKMSIEDASDLEKEFKDEFKKLDKVVNMIKQPSKKKTVKKADPSDLQAPIDVAPETAMQVKEPFITQDIEMVQETAPKPDPNFIPRIPCNDPPKVVEEVPRRNPNGDPFDTMYARQRKAQ